MKWTDVTQNTEVLSRMKLGTPVLLRKIMCRQHQFFGHFARGSAGEELRECVRSSDKKIERGRRKIRCMDAISEMTGGKGVVTPLSESRDLAILQGLGQVVKLYV